MTAVVLAALLVAAMLAVGTTVGVADLAALVRRPVPLVATGVVNVVVVPGLAVALLWRSGVDGPVGLGVVLAAAAPGEASGVLLAHHAGGRPALAVAVQAVLAGVSVVVVAGWVAVSAGPLGLAAPTLPVGGAAALVLAGLVGQLAPLAVGMWLRARRPGLAVRVHAVARRLADVLLAGVVVGSLAANVDRLADVPAAAYAVMVVTVAGSLVAYAGPGLGGPGERSAVAMVTTVRNLSLALFVAAFSTDADRVVLIVLTYGLVMYLAAAAAAGPMRRRARATCDGG